MIKKLHVYARTRAQKRCSETRSINILIGGKIQWLVQNSMEQEEENHL